MKLLVKWERPIQRVHDIGEWDPKPNSGNYKGNFLMEVDNDLSIKAVRDLALAKVYAETADQINPEKDIPGITRLSIQL